LEPRCGTVKTTNKPCGRDGPADGFARSPRHRADRPRHPFAQNRLPFGSPQPANRWRPRGAEHRILGCFSNPPRSSICIL